MTEMEYLALVTELEHAFAAIGEPLPSSVVQNGDYLFLADGPIVVQFGIVVEPAGMTGFGFCAINGLNYAGIDNDSWDAKTQASLAALATRCADDFAHHRRTNRGRA